MTPEAQRIEIAQACGWVNIQRGEIIGKWIGPSPEYKMARTKLPDFLNDLNAMHEAEKTMTYDQKLLYEEWLVELMGVVIFGATAAQRAEAFLRTIGKWDESKTDASQRFNSNMTLLLPLLAVSAPATGTLLGLLFWVAIAAVVIWAIIALVKWSGVPIPQPVWIIFIALISIFLIILLFRAFGMIT